MPGNALKSLKDELRISIGDKETKFILERYGYRCGEELSEKIGVKCKTLEDIVEIFKALWAEIGLGRAYATTMLGEELMVKFETDETFTKGEYCEFIKGYLNGIADKLLGSKFYCYEKECVAKGSEYCIFQLVPTHEYLKPVRIKVSKREPLKYKLESGISYLLRDSSPATGYDIFIDAITHNYCGLIATRDYPEKLRTRYKDLGSTPIIWLTDAEKEYAIAPDDLSRLYYEMVSFLKKAKNAFILLVGLEYLLSNNSFKSVLKFLQLLKDQTALYSSVVLVPLATQVIGERELKLIEKELVIFES
jgi:predicted hydrocarbon binding protein